jgi:hypothetical protein
VWVRATVKTGKVDAMNHVRGVVMLLAGIFALWKGWQIHTGGHAWMAYGLGALAFGMAAWHFTRKGDARRI